MAARQNRPEPLEDVGNRRKQPARKAHPALELDYGMRFPRTACLGNWGPLFGQIPGCIFRLRAPGKLCPILDAHSGMRFPQLAGAALKDCPKLPAGKERPQVPGSQ